MSFKKIIFSVMSILILVFIISKVLAKKADLVYSSKVPVKSSITTESSKAKPQNKTLDKATVKKQMSIMLDPGHGGKDYGTVSGKLLEKNINLDIAGYLKNCLLKNGYHVLMTREKDIFPGDKSNIAGSLEKKDVAARVKILNSSIASLFVSLHVDCDPSQPQRNGSIVYYNPSIKNSDKLAVALQNELNRVTVKGKKRSTNLSSTADFYILKNTDIPGVLVETGFISNKAEMEGFLQEKFRMDIANAICNGINKFNTNSTYLKTKNESAILP